MNPGSDLVKLEVESENNRLRVIVSTEVPAGLSEEDKQRVREELYLRATKTLDNVTDMLNEMDEENRG